MGETKRGTVKFFNFLKGFGFIQHDGLDYFVHVTDLVDADILLDGEYVEFRAVQGHKGWQALDVTRIAPPDLQDERGRVKFYNALKGYGFVERPGKADVFVHFTDLLGDQGGKVLGEGVEVAFQVRKGRDGRDRAYKVRILG